jgi:hypothetical protein
VVSGRAVRALGGGRAGMGAFDRDPMTAQTDTPGSVAGNFRPDSAFWPSGTWRTAPICEAAGRVAIAFREIVAIFCLINYKSGFIETIMEVYVSY